MYWENKGSTQKQLKVISDKTGISISTLKLIVRDITEASNFIDKLLHGDIQAKNEVIDKLKNRIDSNSYFLARKESKQKMIKDTKELQSLPFSEKLKYVPICVKMYLFSDTEKKTIKELDVHIEGDESEKQYRDLKIWNSKKQIDDLVIRRIGFTDDEIREQYTSDIGKNNTTKIYRSVEQTIRELRTNGTITDWNNNIGGVWRLTYIELISHDEPKSIEHNKEKPIMELQRLNSHQTMENFQLPILHENDIRKGYEEISKELLIKKETINQILIALMSKRHVLLTGPIGTGKTHLAKKIPEVFWNRCGGYISEEYTATSDWSVQDVIGGVFPTMDGENIAYTFLNGCLLETLKKDAEQKNKHQSGNTNTPRGVWLSIDEFNRADIDKAFGQLFTGLRTGEIKVFLNNKDDTFRRIIIPNDFRIIGTMNITDKTFLYNLSDALKSRFAFIEIDVPEYELKDKEMIMALKNAIKELEINPNEIGIELFRDENLIESKLSNQNVVSVLEYATEILSLVRCFKKLGTSILKTIFQSLLVSFNTNQSKETDHQKLFEYYSESIDIAILSTIIPQLENLDNRSDLDVLKAVLEGRLVDYIQDSQKDIERENNLKSIKKILGFFNMDIKTQEDFVKEYDSGNTINFSKIKQKISEKTKLKIYHLPETIKALSNLQENMIL